MFIKTTTRLVSMMMIGAMLLTGCKAGEDSYIVTEDDVKSVGDILEDVASGSSASADEDTDDNADSSSSIKVPEKNLKPTINKVGEIADFGFAKSDECVLYNVDENGQNQSVYDPKGNKIDQIKNFYSSQVDVGDDLLDDYYVLEDVNSRPRKVCVMKADGSVVLPIDKVNMVNSIGDYNGKTRYLKCIVAEEQTKNKDECIIYEHDDKISLEPSDKDTLYKGYIQVFDLKKGKYVNNIKITKGRYIDQVGDSIKVDCDDGLTRLYSSSGKVIIENISDSDYKISEPYITKVVGNVTTVYDCNLHELFTTKENVSGFGSINGYVRFKKGEKYGVLDEKGKTVIKPEYDDIDADPYRFIVKKGEKRGLLTHDGKKVTDIKYKYVSSEKGGYYHATYEDDDKESLIGPEGELITDDTKNINALDLAVKKKIDGKNKYYLFKDKSYSLEIDTFSTFKLGVINHDNAKDKYGVYELYEGKKLLEPEYDKIIKAWNRLYAIKGNKCEVYKIEYK